jgi:DNA-binding GntR family transcriptional regulator
VAAADQQLPSQTLAALLRAEIEGSAKYPPGTRLPSYRKLAAEHGVAVNTAQAAIRLLEAEGLVSVRVGSGAYVREPADKDGEPDLRSRLTELQARLRRTQQDVASAERDLADVIERLPTGRSRD